MASAAESIPCSNELNSVKTPRRGQLCGLPRSLDTSLGAARRRESRARKTKPRAAGGLWTRLVPRRRSARAADGGEPFSPHPRERALESRAALQERVCAGRAPALAPRPALDAPIAAA